MEYIKEINIVEAIIHILDNNAEEPILNEYKLELNDEIYKFLFKHVERCLRDDELKYAIFNQERNIVKDLSQEYLNGENNLLEVSKEMARQLFILMKSKGNIPSCDLIAVSISTEYGPILGILKMDYIKNFTHKIDFLENKIGINIIPELTGLPVSSQRIQKCAFIKPIRDEQNFNLMVIDKKSGSNKDNEDYGSNYFISNYLGCSIVNNERDVTKKFVSAAENFARNNFKEDAINAETLRSTIKRKLKEEDSIDVKVLSEDLFNDAKDAKEVQQEFIQYVTKQGVTENINVDKEWVEKKLKRKRLKIDKDIYIYINDEAYHDDNRFEIHSNGDGSINMVIKHVMNYTEK